MSVKNSNELPSYFQVPKHEELVKYVQDLDPVERGLVDGAVYEIAKRDQVAIPSWDLEWGHHHVLEDDKRLIAALLERRKTYVQSESGCSKRIADLLISHCPLVNCHQMTEDVMNDLVQRAKKLSELEALQEQLIQKYPQLKIFGDDCNETYFRGWKGQEIFLLTHPLCMNLKEQQRFNYFASVVRELIVGGYDPLNAGMILDRLLARESLHCTASDLECHIRLLELKNITKRQIADCSISRGDESFCKDIFIVPSTVDKQGKFKPLHPRNALKEAYAYRCDRMLGIGMTAPTSVLKPYNFLRPLILAQELFRSAILLQSRKDIEGAEEARQRAYKLINSQDLPAEVRNSLFGEMYVLCGEHRQIDSLGEKLMYNRDGHEVSDKYRELAIQNYLSSEGFKEHTRKYGSQGSVQIWLNHCSKRAYEYIVKDLEGGAKLKTAPKALAHFYALLGMLKGSMDCASGNTLVEFDQKENRVSNFWDMDDERSMPSSNDFWHIRMWQMGLPQCAEPFDKAFLLLFSDPSIVDKLKRLQRSLEIPSSEYRAQIQRLEKIITLFTEESKKSKITLTPRELFFTLFPGSKDDYDRIKKRFNDDTTYDEKGIRISPIELFEFHLPEMGRNAWYTGIEDEKRNIGSNMRTLYFPDDP